MKRHVVLVGLPGSGKSAVGRLVARALEVRSHDVDAAVERLCGASVREIFTTRGESEFRRLEKLETERLLGGPPAVIVPGGGWAAVPGNLETTRGRALTVYLETSPDTAAQRTAHSDDRPLLDGPDRGERLKDLLTARGRFYASCDVTVSTEDRTAEQVAAEVVELAQRAHGG